MRCTIGCRILNIEMHRLLLKLRLRFWIVDLEDWLHGSIHPKNEIVASSWHSLVPEALKLFISRLLVNVNPIVIYHRTHFTLRPYTHTTPARQYIQYEIIVKTYLRLQTRDCGGYSAATCAVGWNPAIRNTFFFCGTEDHHDGQ